MTARQVTQALPSPLLRAFAPLHKTALGVACGVVLGGSIFFISAALLIHGGQPDFGIELLGQFFVGYSLTWTGAFIGLLWGLGAGFIFGWSFALLRNLVFWAWLLGIRSRADMEQYNDFLDHL